jgi:hypothetical protein
VTDPFEVADRGGESPAGLGDGRRKKAPLVRLHGAGEGTGRCGQERTIRRIVVKPQAGCFEVPDELSGCSQLLLAGSGQLRRRHKASVEGHERLGFGVRE